MKPIQLNNHQIEALNNGCTMLWMPITRDMKVYSRMKDYEENGLDATIELDDILKGEVEPYDETKDLIKYSSPLQIEQEYYVQEEFLSYERYLVVYKAEADKNLRNDLTSKELQDYHSVKWKDASQMEEHQSRIKFKVTDIQVKRVQDIVAIDGEFMDYVNSLKEDEYEDNPYGFLVTTERLT